MGRVFITGVTGFVGRYMVDRIVRRADVDGVDVLVRARDEEHARQRLLKSMRYAVSGERAEEVVSLMTPVIGDLKSERFGLDEATWQALAERTDSILHAAANVRFDQRIEDARAENVFGTQQAAALGLEAQQRGGLRRFDWVGTAFVAGLRRDVVGEGDLRHDAGWKNPYEQSKYEAELWLREEASSLPLTVFRPSIVVGESATGATTNFGMMYWPIRLYSKGWWRTVVGSAKTPVDIVPVDFVAGAIECLSRSGQPVGATYHLTAGTDGAVTIERLAELVQEFFGGRGPRFMDPDFFMKWVRPVVDLFLWGPRRRVLQEGGRFFIPYFSGNPLFDNTDAAAALAAHGIDVPRVDDYFTNLLTFCRDTDFGKHPPS